jgi:glycosyltransferase involved in cell wall biosynthesis
MFWQKRPKSCVCFICKDEGKYLVELIAYYAALGFDKIIVYDNGSSDESQRLLPALKARFGIEIRPWIVSNNVSPQISAYEHAIRNCRAEWMLFVDADEFLVLHNHKTINEFLEQFDSRQDVSLIGFNWRIFGDAFLDDNDGRPVIERLTYASLKDFSVNHHVKSIFRRRSQTGMVNMHACETNGQMVLPDGSNLTMTQNWGLITSVDFSVAQINHYYGKTWAEFEKKIYRGQAGVPEIDDQKYCYTKDYFNVHNRNECIDISAQKFLPQVKAAIQEIGSALF